MRSRTPNTLMTDAWMLAASRSIRYEAAMLRGIGRCARRIFDLRSAGVQTQRARHRTGGLSQSVGPAFLCASVLIATQFFPSAASALTGDVGVPATEALEDTVVVGILTPKDVSRYQRIFELQEDGNWKAADKEIAQLDDRILMGHVLYQRFMHPTKYRSKFKELAAWMKQYADHPGAYRVYRLARKRKPVRTRAPQPPVRPNANKGIETVAAESGKYVSPRKRGRAKRREVRRQQSHIRSHIRNRRLGDAIKHLKSRKYRDLLDETEIAVLYAQIAKGYFQLGHDERAFELASQNASRARTYEPVVDMYAGLAAWRLGRKSEAAAHFGALSDSRTASDREATFGAFWAARAHLVDRSPENVTHYLRIAASQPRTFYGQLARRLMGDNGPPAWNAPVLFPADYARLKDSPYVRRAVALSQSGRLYLAERELRAAFVAAPGNARKAMLALAVRLGLPGAELRLARSILASDGDAYDRALFPVPPWEPEGGFQIDRAVLFALMRQESGFNSRAKSGAGARGLMQLMPRTASFMARDRSLRGRNKQKLFAPEYNVHLGQKYVVHLMTQHDFLDNLVMVVAAYNGGPGNVKKWQRRIKESEDPLMFIESLPSRENREFVRRVFTNMWIYRSRFEQPAPSLDALAEGRWPEYHALDSRVDTARNQEVDVDVLQD